MPRGPDRAATPPAAGGVRLFVDLLAFACELAMLVLLAISGWSLGGGGLLGIALAVLYPALAILVWTVLIAPTAARRLRDPTRFVVQVILFGLTAAATAASGRVVLGVVFGAIAVTVFAVTRLTGATVTGNYN
jgi:hypothetical protein